MKKIITMIINSHITTINIRGATQQSQILNLELPDHTQTCNGQCISHDKHLNTAYKQQSEIPINNYFHITLLLFQIMHILSRLNCSHAYQQQVSSNPYNAFFLGASEKNTASSLSLENMNLSKILEQNQ